MSGNENKIPEKLCQEFFRNSPKRAERNNNVRPKNRWSFSAIDGKALRSNFVETG
jgi:hypothetical protein